MARGRKSKRKKRVEEPVPPEQKPPIDQTTTTLDWESNWQESRTIQEGQTDPKDSRCKLLKVGEPAAKATIGNGEMKLNGGSPRFYIMGQYQNVEFQSEIYAESNTEQLYLSARSNHERRPEGFGGYPLYIDVTEGSIFFKKEATHVIGYSSRLASVNVPSAKPNTWIRAKVSITNIESNKVKCEAWVNDTYTSFIDSGHIKCGDQSNTSPFTGIGESCFFRVNSSGEKGTASVAVRYRNAKITKK